MFTALGLSLKTTQKLQNALIVSATALAIGCASKVQKVEYAANTNPPDEITSLRNDMTQASKDQVDVMSPRNFSDAEKSLAKAEKYQSKNSDNEKVLSELGYARAYYNKAVENSGKVKAAIPEVVQAREAAIKANAQAQDKENFRDADNDMMKIGSRFEKGKESVETKERTELQARYLDIEMQAIKEGKLGPARAKIEAAKKAGAKRLAPKTLDSAEAKFKNAEAVLTANRHDDSATQGAVDAVNAEAQKLALVTQTAKNAKSQNSEDVALDLVNKNAQIGTLDQQLGTVESQRAAQAAELNKTNAQLSAAQIAAQRRANALAAEQKFNASFEEARKQFSPDEAEVYRQGNNLLIRLKGLNFSSGRAELPPKSLAILSKTKGIIQEMNAEKVIVEGHTDSVGTRQVNTTLSQNRADAVAKYLVTEEAIQQDEVEAKGFGFEKPISSNKTKEGRAQNRRVDVIITPATQL